MVKMTGRARTRTHTYFATLPNCCFQFVLYPHFLPSKRIYTTQLATECTQTLRRPFQAYQFSVHYISMFSEFRLLRYLMAPLISFLAVHVAFSYNNRNRTEWT